MDCKKIAILASGNGSNAENLIMHSKNMQSLKIVCVITDNKDAFVIQRCKKLNTLCFIINNSDPDLQEREMLDLLNKHNVEWILLAGFMKILSTDFLQNYFDEKLKNYKIINIHPSLLPLFKGRNSYKRAFNKNVIKSGVTVHLVDSKIDHGPIILQKAFHRKASDSLTEFMQRGLKLEHMLYRKTLDLLNQNQISYKKTSR